MRWTLMDVDGQTSKHALRAGKRAMIARGAYLVEGRRSAMGARMLFQAWVA
jgi:hypothetical protein